MSGHTPEPWYAHHVGPLVTTKNDEILCETDGSTRLDNRDRIVACVNALAGIADPAAFVAKVREVCAGKLPVWYPDDSALLELVAMVGMKMDGSKP